MANSPTTIFNPPRRRELWLRQLLRKWNTNRDVNPQDSPSECGYEFTELGLEEQAKDEEQRLVQSFGSLRTGLRGGTNMTLLRGQSETLRQQFSERRQYRVAVHTWNVAGKPPPEDLDLGGLIDNTSGPADIYVFGFQEVVPLNANNVLYIQNPGPASLWEAKIRATLNNLHTPPPPKQAPQPTSLHKWLSVPLSSIHDADADADALTTSVTDAVPEVSDVQRLIAELTVPESITMDPVQKLANSNVNGARREGYSRVASKQMAGLFVTVWVRSHLWRSVHNVQVSTVGCGLMNHLGNKGAISVSMFLHYTSFCFVCSHLTSGHKEGDALRRNSDVGEILRRTKFPRLAKLLGLGLPETIIAHDRVIWLGDLNYRLAVPEKETWTLVKLGDWAGLLRHDQLKLEQGEGRVFPDWQEGHISFPPTYKFVDGSDRFFGDGDGDGKGEGEGNGNGINPNSRSAKRRSPAWCDRVLWHGKGLHQLDYTRDDLKLSDHRAVSATFMVEVKIVSLKKLKRACLYPMDHDAMDMQYKIVPMVKPYIDFCNLHNNEAWGNLFKTLSLQHHQPDNSNLDMT